jgi:odorant receptor
MIFKIKAEFKDLMETSSGFFPKTKEEQNIFKVGKYFRGYKRMERAFSILACSTGVVFIAVPIVRFVMSGVWIDELPFHNWFPFDELDVRYYNFVLLWEFINSVHSIASILGPDLIFYAFITLISMQLDILSCELENARNLPDKEVFKKLKKLVKDHERLIRLPKNLEKIYSVSILFNFIASSILICLGGYQVSIGITFEIQAKFASLLVISLMQVFILCYYGNKLTTAGENVAKAAYESGWHEFQDRQARKAIILIMRRSQKPCAITASKFAIVSLASFTSVSFIVILLKFFVKYCSTDLERIVGETV